MLRFFSYRLLILLTLILVSVIACTESEPTSPIEQIQTKPIESLLSTVNTFNDAFRQGNVEQLAQLITDDYQHTNGNAKAINRSAWLTYLRKRQNELKDSTLIIRSYQMHENQIKQYPHAAILTAKIVVKEERNGVLDEKAFRVTNVWVEEDGKWKRAAFHDSKL